MSDSTTKVPQEFDSLPEPARAKATHAFRSLIEQGESESDALAQAQELASQWITERAPGN